MNDLHMQKIDLNNKNILVTGAAGFIGSNLVKRLFKDATGSTIVGIDNMNAYYDVSLKEYRLKDLSNISKQSANNQYNFVRGDIADKKLIDNLFDKYHFDIVVNLAAQAGVRYSIENPDAYIQSNIIGFYNILEACRHNPVEHLVYASSSSVYGGNSRDFTYVDDIVEGVVRVMCGAPDRRNGDDGLPIQPYAVYNIGGGQPENLLDFVRTLQEELVRANVLPPDYDFEAHKELVPMSPGDVPTTYADTKDLERDFGFTPQITLREGLRKFAEWYKDFYRI